MSRSTPWGSAQSVVTHLRGFATVMTAGHGGMMISKGMAEKHLSEAARKRASMHGSYYCYEEDCDYLIPLYDAKELRPQLLQGNPFWEEKTEQEIEKYLIDSISVWNPDYLLDVGVDPEKEGYKTWILRKRSDELYKNKDADLVTSCSGESSTLLKGIFQVHAADDQIHYVTAESYQAVREDKYLAILNPLSAMEVITPNKIPPMKNRLLPYGVAKAQDMMKKYSLVNGDTLQGDVSGAKKELNRYMEKAINTCIHHLYFTDKMPLGTIEYHVDRQIATLDFQLHKDLRPVIDVMNRESHKALKTKLDYEARTVSMAV